MDSQWLTSFHKANPELSPLLALAGITDDGTYWERESQLSPEMRRHLGKFRFASLAAGKDPTDPCIAAACAPPWLSLRPWTDLPVTAGTAALFAEQGIKLVSDLESFTAQQLLQFKYFGKKALTKVRNVLERAIEEGPTHAQSRQHDSSANLSTASSWISALYVLSPEQALHLQTAGITDDATYLDLEGRLPHVLRRDVGIFRSRQLLPGNRNDLPSLVASLPPWLTKRDIASLPITTTTFDLCHSKGIVRVADLELVPLATTGKYKVSHLKKARNLLTSLEQELQAGPREMPPSLMGILDAFMALMPCETMEMLKVRLGLRQLRCTLRTTGKLFSVSRQNVFIKEQHLFARLSRFWDFKAVLSGRLRALLDQARVPLPLASLPEADPWFAGCTDPPPLMQTLLRNVLDDAVNILKIDQTEYLTRMNAAQWQWLTRLGREKTAIAFSRGWNDTLCRMGLANYLSDRTREMAPLLWEKVKAEYLRGRIWERNVRIPNDCISFAISLLKLLNTVPHTVRYTRLADMASEAMNSPVDSNLVLAILRETAIPFGRGHYGLTRHLRLTRTQMRKLAQDAATIVSGSHQPWHCTEILNHFPVGQLPPMTDRFHLDIALRKAGTLTKVGFQLWVDSQSATNLLKDVLKRTAVAILEDVGCPLSEEELMQRVGMRVHVAGPFVLLPEDPLLRCDEGCWGLNDRDFGLKNRDQPAFLDEVVDCLRQFAVGIPLQWLGRYMRRELASGALGLLAMDSRIDVLNGNVALTEW